jgi:hypothetical protein
LRPALFGGFDPVLNSGTLIAFSRRVEERIMKCYFSAKSESKDKSKEERILISFAIPELGVLFRTHYTGNFYECTYISLLKLLKFIETNPEVFEKGKIEVLSHDPAIVYQVNQKTACDGSLEKLNGLALLYKRRLKYSLNWIPLNENKAEKGLLDQPQSRSQVPLNFCELDESIRNGIDRISDSISGKLTV